MHYFLHVKDDKLDSRTKKAIFVDLEMGVKGNKIWELSLKKINVSMYVTFDESYLMKHKVPTR